MFLPLCGKSRDMLWLRAQRHPVLGVVLSDLAVRDFFAENDLEASVTRRWPFDHWECGSLTLIGGDIFYLRPTHLGGCVGVYDQASLMALPVTPRDRYARYMKELLPPAAQILLVTMEDPDGEMQGPPFPVHEVEVRSLYGDLLQVEQLYELDCLAETRSVLSSYLSWLVEKVYRLRPSVM